MPGWAETALGWAMVVALILAVWWGRRASRRKSNNLRAAGYAQGMRDFEQRFSQMVVVHGDDRRTQVAGIPAEFLGSADDRGYADPVGLRTARMGGGVPELDRGDRARPYDHGPALVPGAGYDGSARLRFPEGLSDDLDPAVAARILDQDRDRVRAVQAERYQSWSVDDEAV